MTSKARKRRRSNSRWPDRMITVLFMFVQVNAVLYAWFGGRSGPTK